MHRLQLFWLDSEVKNLEARWGVRRSKPSILTQAQRAKLPVHNAYMKPVGCIKNYKQTFHRTHTGSIRRRTFCTNPATNEAGGRRAREGVGGTNVSARFMSRRAYVNYKYKHEV